MAEINTYNNPPIGVAGAAERMEMSGEKDNYLIMHLVDYHMEQFTPPDDTRKSEEGEQSSSSSSYNGSI